jgi:hypothetical protein
MDGKELEKRYQSLKSDLADTKIRIRRYSLDPRLKERPGEDDDTLRLRADNAWKKWLEVRDKFVALPVSPTAADINIVERAWLELDRDVDLIQRELICEHSYSAGVITVVWMVVAVILLILFYLTSHGVRSLDFSTFETWPEWGPLKYAEVACWSLFGVFCYLLFLATYYLARRDFDKWYQPWYISTAIRGVFFSVILMMIVLEFVEWYGENTWVRDYILEEGNKYYLIVFISFCLGLASDRTVGIIGDLSDGVTEFVSRAVGRISDKLSNAVTKGDLAGK